MTRSERPRPDPSRTLRAREPEDLIAIAPVVLGFWPERSVVMLTCGAERPLHGRTDLPDEPVGSRAGAEALAALVPLLVAPATRYGARRVILLYYGEEPASVARAHGVLAPAFEEAGIEVLSAMRVGAEVWCQLLDPSERGSGFATESAPRAYDVSTHPVVLQAIVDGRLTHATRADLVASLESDPVRTEAVAACAAAAGRPDEGPGPLVLALLAEGRWVESTVRELLATARTPTDEELARLLWGMRHVRVRDAAWVSLRADNADAHVALWSAVLRRTPEDDAAPPASLLGFAAWQAGNGALAWAACDRALGADPGYSLAGLLHRILSDALDPGTWPGSFDWAEGLAR